MGNDFTNHPLEATPMNRSLIPFAKILVVSTVVAASGSSASADDNIRYPGYLPSFPAPAPAIGVGLNAEPGVWLGGDAGFVCPLDSENSFWTFTDISIGPIGAQTRADSTNHKKGIALGNSVAIATCRNGRFLVTHYYRGSPEFPLPFFTDPNNPNNLAGGTRLWPRKASLIDGKLYVFAHQGNDPGNVFNTLIIRVANPQESPAHWLMDYVTVGLYAAPAPHQTLPQAPTHFGNETLVDLTGTYLYTYGVYASNAPDTGPYSQKF